MAETSLKDHRCAIAFAPLGEAAGNARRVGGVRARALKVSGGKAGLDNGGDLGRFLHETWQQVISLHESRKTAVWKGSDSETTLSGGTKYSMPTMCKATTQQDGLSVLRRSCMNVVDDMRT